MYNNIQIYEELSLIEENSNSKKTDIDMYN